MICAISVPIKKQKIFDISHLCHFKNCVNPDHLVIESHKNNEIGNTYLNKVAYDVFGVDERIYIDPCTHRNTTAIKKKCILPIVKIENAGYYEGLSAEQRGASQA